ncbi:MAG: hypothetical protein PHV74_04875 [Dehalococcoidia bacterium]|nr:hypothetical protein [Dehalococcoidia bacterium]
MKDGGIIGSVLLAFIAVVIIMNLIPSLVDTNAVVQADADASELTKMASSMGEWMLPLGGIVAAGFLVFRQVKR